MAAQAKLEDSNISNYGSKEHKDLKLHAAQSERAWDGCGKKVGVEKWRIEKFKVVKHPTNNSFYSGDAYIILNTYKLPDNDAKLLYNVHFWLGAACTQDEQGTAAYKTVELDDLLGDLPVQYREVQGCESEEFLKCMGGEIKIMEGGVDSGFNNIKPQEYQPRLLHVKGKNNNVRVSEVKRDKSSLNAGDVFILDCGLKIFQWNGKTGGIFEKRKANEVVQALKKERNGKPTSVVLDNMEDNDEFWALLGGKPRAESEIAPATSDDVKIVHSKKLFRLSDNDGKSAVTLTEVAAQGGHFSRGQLDCKDVFILDAGHTVFSWIGNQTSKNERASAIKFATDYLASHGRPASTPVVRVLEGKESPKFLAELR